MNIIKLITILFITSLSLFATQLADDQFATSTDGYTGSGVSYYSSSGGWVIIGQDSTATKTYSFGSNYANQTVEIEYIYYASNEWDRSWWSDYDYLYIYVNDVLVETYNPSADNAYVASVIATTDSNGDLKVQFKTDTEDSNEWAAIDYVTINTAISTSTNERDFDLRNPVETRNINGDYQSIGNSVLCYKDGGNECVDYNGTSRNNDLSLNFIDTDNVSNTFNNSSQAQLNIPSDSTVVWAAIYTQGNIDGLDSSVLEDPITLTVPNMIDPISITPKQIDTLSYVYSTYSDIPELVGKKGSEINGYVTAANIKAREGQHSSLGYYGAWTLVVIYKDLTLPLKNISVFDGYKQISSSNEDPIPVSGFLTPSSGEVVSTLSVFAGEGDKNIDGDTLFLNSTSIGYKDSYDNDNAFYSNISPDIIRNPSYTNNQGIDIQTFDVGTSGLNLVNLGDTNASIEFQSDGDVYFPSLAIFSTNLYEPRVCYSQEFFNEDGSKLLNPSVDDIIIVETWISNMKKDAADGNLEDAEAVEVTIVYDKNNLEYIAGSTYVKNVPDGENLYNYRTDTIADDIVDLIDENTSKWRVGQGADATTGGFLAANPYGDDAYKVYIKYKARLKQGGDINISNEFLVAYENSQLGLRFDDDSRVNIFECTDVNNSFNVGPSAGLFNVVSQTFSGTLDPLDVTDPLNAIPTQIANRAIGVKILSLASDYTTLSPYTGEVTLQMIETPTYGLDPSANQIACEGATLITESPALQFTVQDTLTTTMLTQNAYKNASFRVKYDTDKYVCSRDVFSIRPEQFLFSSASNLDLLISGVLNNITLKAVQYSSSTKTTNYSILNVNNSIFNITTNKYASLTSTAYDNTLNGIVTIADTNFDIKDGESTNTLVTDVVPLKYTDVGKLNIQIEDRTWAQVDIDNPGDSTPQDCSANGAYICGTLTPTFIPASFNFSQVSLANDGNGFTYLSSDLNSSAKFVITLNAVNSIGTTTQNFSTLKWEQPVDITFNINTANTPAIIKSQANSTSNLGFINGNFATTTTETNSSKNLIFNFTRTTNTRLNPFLVNGTTDISLNATSTYTATDGTTATITGTSASVTDGTNANFIYGRTHAPRQRFQANSGTIYIYYEAFCSATDVNNVTCNKALLPNGLASQSTDNPRWFKNTLHTLTSGSIGNISQKYVNKINITNVVNNIGNTTATLTYTGTIYPYKATMQNSADTWLIYDQYSPAGATQNEFEVEFDKTSSTWGGVAETNSSTTTSGSMKTNRRIMW